MKTAWKRNPQGLDQEKAKALDGSSGGPVKFERARPLFILGCIFFGTYLNQAFADDKESSVHESVSHEGVSHKVVTRTSEHRVRELAPTVAMREPSGKAIRAKEIFQAANQTEIFVTRKNLRVELAPFSVVELDEEGDLKLLRGSALFETKVPQTVRTSSATLDIVGRALASYDHKERASSAFVLEGESRISNANGKDKSLRLERFQGASLEIHSVMPQMIRQLDVAALDQWLTGYSWPKNRRTDFFQSIPAKLSVEQNTVKEHLAEVKLEDYFSSIETADEFQQPNYYQQKFADPDQVVAEANAKKADASRPLSPEEAALIALPNTRIDIDMEILGVSQKQLELLKGENEKSAGRSLASESKPKKRVEKKVPAKEVVGDPDIHAVLERLRAVKSREPVLSNQPSVELRRGPASVGTNAVPKGIDAVPDPVYDYSQNF